MNAEYTPLSEANTQRIRTNLELPFRLDNQIGMNIQHIEYLLNLSGISHLKITTAENADTSTNDAVITGFSPNGEAYASKTLKRRVPKSTLSMAKNPEPETTLLFDKNYRWATMQINFNTQEIIRQILDNREVANKPQAWTKIIDSEIRKSILRGGTKHLLTAKTFTDKIAVTAHILNVVGTLRGLSENASINSNTLLPFITPILLSIFLNRVSENEEEYYRVSAFWGFEPDRALLLFFKARSQIIKELGK